MTQPSAGGLHPKVPTKVSKPRKRSTKKNTIAGQPVTKHRVEVAADGAAAVIDAKAGPVTFTDKIKAYYHTLITVIGAILVLLNQVASAVHWIPNYGTQAAGYVSAAIFFLTAVANALKSNEQWVNSL